MCDPVVNNYGVQSTQLFQDCVKYYPGVLLEARTRVAVPVYSEYSTRLRSNEVSSRLKYKIKSQTN